MVIAVGVAFVISFLLYKDQRPVPAAETGSQTGETGEERKEIAGEISDKEAGEEVKEEILVSPAKGKVVPLTEVRDETFASEMLGTTVAVEPSEGKITAPCDGQVSNIFETGHAVCLTTKAGG